MATGSKIRLQICLFIHLLLLVPMLIKMVADVCDALSISPLRIDEYNIPKPIAWEYVWSCSIIFVVYGLVSLQTNKLKVAKLYALVAGDVLFGVAPIVMALTEDHSDFHNGYRVDIQWYAFALVAFPVHSLSILYALETAQWSLV